MLRLAIGAALVGGAAWWGRRGGTLDKAITAGMSDREIAAEMRDRADGAFLFAGNAAAYGEEAVENLKGGPRSRAEACALAREYYLKAIDEIADTRSAFRHPRVAGIIQKCPTPRHGPDTRSQEHMETCADFFAARHDFDWALRDMPLAKKALSSACGITMPPFAGTPIAKAITPSMEDHDFVDEVSFRAREAYGTIDDGFRELYDKAGDDIAEDVDCPGVKQTYMRARDAILESSRAMRTPNARRLASRCGKGRVTEQCRRFRIAVYEHDTSVRSLPTLRTDIHEACGVTMPPMELGR